MKPRLRDILKKENGVALLITVFAITLLVTIVFEVAYETSREYTVTSKEYHQLKAYYAARSGVELSLLRILLYQKLMASFGSQLGAQASMLDMIWQFPFAWPPPVPDELDRVSREQIQGAVKEASLDAQYVVTIASEGSMIDVNALGSPIETLKESTRTQLVKILESAAERDEYLRVSLSPGAIAELVDNLTDWVDPDSEMIGGGGNESTLYTDIPDADLPPNRPFRTLEELHMVAGMNDRLYAALAPKITVYGTKALNINQASREVLLALDPEMTEELVDRIIERREDPSLGGPFASAEDFFEFIGMDLSQTMVPIVTKSVQNFRIKSTGEFRGTTSTIEAVVYDFESVKSHVADLLAKEEEEKKKPGQAGSDPKDGSQPTSTKKNEQSQDASKPKPPSGRPNVIFWSEK